MSWNPNLIVLILFTTCTSYFAALGIERFASSSRAKKAIMAIGITISFLFLFIFKYFNFFSENVVALLRSFSLPVNDISLRLILPVGISFYTFQTVGYVVDVYRGDMPAEKHFGIYALFVSFFPQLVAGPIERATNLLPQFYEKHTLSTAQTSAGLRKILLGLFKKMLVADYVATFVNQVYNNVADYSGTSIIVATFLFAIQIYCDFSGYSDIARGSAQIMGFRLMENFRSPYYSRSVREFWRRWHISLSTWFSDYVYKPLGGSRVSRPRHLLNLMITFILSGFWHGASWTFLLWGALHGAALCIEVFLRPRREQRYALAGKRTQQLLSIWWWLITMAVVMAGWMLFRANSMQEYLMLISRLFQGLNPLNLPLYLQSMGIDLSALVHIIVLVAILALYDWVNRDGTGMQRFTRLHPVLRYGVYYAIAVALLFSIFTTPGGATAEFIYFQF